MGGLGEKALEVTCQLSVLSSHGIEGKWHNRAKGPQKEEKRQELTTVMGLRHLHAGAVL